MSADGASGYRKAGSPDEQEAGHEKRADGDERGLSAMGYRPSAVTIGTFARFAAPDTGPSLDAASGGGGQAEALVPSGRGPRIGLDRSGGVVEVAMLERGGPPGAPSGAQFMPIDAERAARRPHVCGTIDP